MAEGIVERRMSSKQVSKVRKFRGPTINDMYHYLIPLLEKKTDHVILDVGNYEGKEIIDNYSRKTPRNQHYTFKDDNES